jgi:hypothetical protein
MQPLYLARIEDLGQGDLVKVDCAAYHQVALLLTPDRLLRLGLSPRCLISTRASGPGLRSERTSRRVSQVAGRSRATRYAAMALILPGAWSLNISFSIISAVLPIVD